MNIIIKVKLTNEWYKNHQSKILAYKEDIALNSNKLNSDANIRRYISLHTITLQIQYYISYTRGYAVA
jgi:hypothetical protein